MQPVRIVNFWICSSAVCRCPSVLGKAFFESYWGEKAELNCFTLFKNTANKYKKHHELRSSDFFPNSLYIVLSTIPPSPPQPAMPSTLNYALHRGRLESSLLSRSVRTRFILWFRTVVAVTSDHRCDLTAKVDKAGEKILKKTRTKLIALLDFRASLSALPENTSLISLELQLKVRLFILCFNRLNLLAHNPWPVLKR